MLATRVLQVVFGRSSCQRHEGVRVVGSSPGEAGGCASCFCQLCDH